MNVSDEITAPHSTRFPAKAINPFATDAADPLWRPWYNTGDQFKTASDANKDRGTQLTTMIVYPVFLFRRTEGYKQEVWTEYGYSMGSASKFIKTAFETDT